MVTDERLEKMEKQQPKHNYQVDLDRIIRRLERTGEVPTLLLHACCAPCSSYTIEYLSQYFKITLFYYNPNIAPAEEYQHRVNEIKRFVAEFKTKYPVTLVEGEYIKTQKNAMVANLYTQHGFTDCGNGLFHADPNTYTFTPNYIKESLS